MKITRSRLRKIILETVVNEGDSGAGRGKILNAIEDVYGVDQQEAQQIWATVPEDRAAQAVQLASSDWVTEELVESIIRALQERGHLRRS